MVTFYHTNSQAFCCLLLTINYQLFRKLNFAVQYFSSKLKVIINKLQFISACGQAYMCYIFLKRGQTVLSPPPLPPPLLFFGKVRHDYTHTPFFFFCLSRFMRRSNPPPLPFNFRRHCRNVHSNFFFGLCENKIYSMESFDAESFGARNIDTCQ